MFTNLFGNYLIRKGVIDTEQLKQIKTSQARTRAKLGLIAQAEKLITKEQADAINEKQATLDCRFGDIAVEMELMTRDQLKRLLGMQSSPYITFTQAVSDLGLMSVEEVDKNLSDYQKEMGYTSMDMDAIKSGDIDRIMPLLLPEELPWGAAEHVVAAIRTINRLVCDDIYVKSSVISKSYDAAGYAMQNIHGDFESSTAIAGEEEGMLAVASGFAKEEFKKLDEEALDSVAEFVNIIDGLFATAISLDQVDVSLSPPEMSAKEANLRSDMICVVSMELCEKPVDLLISVGSQFTINNNN